MYFTNIGVGEIKSESLYIWLSELVKKKRKGMLATPNDVPAQEFIQKLAQYLKENVEEVSPPPWAGMAKTGSHVQRPPENHDWWYIRCASLLRKIYIHGPLGIERLRAEYGGRKDFGVKPEHAVKGGGASVRKALQQLEAAGLVEEFQKKGRRMTKDGRKLLEEIAEEVKKDILKTNPQLEKYQRGA